MSKWSLYKVCWQNESCLSSRSRWNPDEEESGSWQLPWSQGSYWCWWCWLWKSWNLIRPHTLDKESELDPRRGGEADRVVQDRAVALHVLLRLASHLGHNSVGIKIFPISKHSQLFFSWDCVKRHLTIKILRIQFYENRTTILPLSSWLLPLWQKDQPLAQHQSDSDTFCGESLLDFCFIWRGCKR